MVFWVTLLAAQLAHREGDTVSLSGRELRCRFSNGQLVELRRLPGAGTYELLLVDAGGRVRDLSGLRVRDGKVVEIQTNGGAASQAAVSRLYEELRRSRLRSVAAASRCGHAYKDGTR